MREAKFRGKGLNNGDWLYGDLFHLGGRLRTFLFTEEDYISQFAEKPHRLQREVDPATVGQYTGLYDKNGTMAYAGDIFEDDKGIIRTIFQVPGGFACEANPKSFGFHNPNIYSPIIGLSDEQNASWFSDTCTILGNIHDNPEILESDGELTRKRTDNRK